MLHQKLMPSETNGSALLDGKLSVSSMFDISLCRIKPFEHQIIGVRKLIEHEFFFLADEMGAGKSKQVIDAAQFLFKANIIDRIIIICPASVRGVWFDIDLGELVKHLWQSVPARIAEYHSKVRSWMWPIGRQYIEGERVLRVTISNYDFVRADHRRIELLRVCNARTLLVLDESSAVKNYKAKQTKACKELRQACGRVVLLNGTPIANNPGDMYSQSELLNPAILGCKSWFHFRAKYAVMGGWQQKQIVDWINIDDLQRRLAPYVLRRLKEQCLDLPPKLPPVTLTATLTPSLWKIYTAMRNEMVAWLSDATVSVASQAAVKALRLAQITSGFAGGLEQDGLWQGEGERPDFIADVPNQQISPVQEIGREKLDVLLEWIRNQIDADPLFKLLVWCRFRPEVERLYRHLFNSDVRVQVGRIWGNQSQKDRDVAIRLLDPRTTPHAPVVVIGTPGSGALGLNLTATRTAIYCSNDYNLKNRLQSEDRVHRPGQHSPVSYYDIVAVGPKGQKTIDHQILKALRTKQDVAAWTTRAWIQALMEE